MLTIKRLTLLTIVISYLLIVFGGFVASSESGMGCGPEWPLCNGQVIPELRGDTLIEFAHRAIALVVVILAAVLYVKVKKESPDIALHRGANWMVPILAVLVVAGAFVVVYDLPPMVVTTHLMLAMIFMGTLLWINRFEDVENFHKSFPTGKRRSIVFHTNVLIVLTLLTFAIGGYIKHQSYGLACGWLDCGTSFLPGTWPQFLQTFHRLLAIVTTVYTIFIAYWTFAKKWGRSLQNRFMLASLTVLLQLVSGVLTVVTYIPISWAVIHLAIGTILFIIFTDTRASLGITKSASKIEAPSNEYSSM